MTCYFLANLIYYDNR